MLRRFWLTALLILGYLAVAFYLVFLSRNKLTPDAAAYVQLARHYAHGELGLVVNSWWSPLYSWLLVPLVWAGVEIILAAKILAVFLGLGFACGVRRLVREALGGPYLHLSFAAALLLALPMLPTLVTPDLLLAALLAWYFALSFPLLRRDSFPAALAAGALGGLAFLAKAYAWPFVAAHLALTFCLRRWLVRRNLAQGRVWPLWLAAVAGLVIVSSPWIAIISVHEKALTISSAARHDCLECLATPCPVPEVRPPWVLQRPRPGRLLAWENPTEDAGWPPLWSPWDSAAALKCQAATLAGNLLTTWKILKSWDSFGLLAAGLCLGVLLLAFRPGFSAGGRGTFLLWAYGSIIIYVLGYALIVTEDRFLWPVAALLLALFLAGLAILKTGCHTLSRRAVSPGKVCVQTAHLAPITLAAALLLSLGLHAIAVVQDWRGPCGRGAEADWIRQSARQFDSGDPVAVNLDGSSLGLAAAFWTGREFLGVSTADSAATLAHDLAPFGRTEFLVYDDPPLADRLDADPSFRRIGASLNPRSGRRLWAFQSTVARASCP